jgi:hypothetical protein
MTSRRRFIHASVAMAATGAIGGIGLPLRSPSKERPHAPGAQLNPHAVVVDQRFDESIEFGLSLALLGSHTYNMRGDVTDVWYTRLHPLWKAGGVAVAGLTGSGVLFCLERLAWDHGLRVVYRGSHQRFADSRVYHAMLGNADWSALGGDTTDRNYRWPTAVAAAAARIESPCPAVPVDHALRPVCSTGAADQGRGAISTLFSWVIAPPARA